MRASARRTLDTATPYLAAAAAGVQPLRWRWETASVTSRDWRAVITGHQARSRGRRTDRGAGSAWQAEIAVEPTAGWSR